MSTRLPRAERRAQLIEAAAAAFLARGFDGTSMDDVAQEAGVTRLIVYRIFENKHDLYRAVLVTLIDELARAFDGVDVEAVRVRGAAKVLLPVARAQPDAFRLLWRHAWHEPDFADEAVGFRSYVTRYAKEILASYIPDDPPRLEWAARSAGAHLIESICVWLDVGDATRDEEIGDLLTGGLRALAGSWIIGGPPQAAPPAKRWAQGS
jgi:AcrR family transcriptional regulator